MKEVETKWHEGKYALQGKLKDRQRKDSENDNCNDDDEDDDGYSFYRRILEIYTPFLSSTRPSSIPKLVLEIGSTQSRPVQEMYREEGRMEVYKETFERAKVGTWEYGRDGEELVDLRKGPMNVMTRYTVSISPGSHRRKEHPG
jgi:hypothetical protein